MGTNGRIIAAAAAALALLAASCGTGSEPPSQTATATAATSPAADSETATTGATEQAVEASEAEPAAQKPPATTIIEMGEAAAEAAVAEAGSVVETVPESERPCPEGEHRHDTGEACHPDDHGPAPEETEEGPQATPVLVVDPVVAPEGFNTFTLKGTDFEPNAVIHTLSCALPGDGALSADSSAGEITAALELITPASAFIYCDLEALQAVNADSEGSFTVHRDAVVVRNLAWIASDIADPQQSAGTVVFVEAPEAEPTATTTTEPPAATTTTTTTEQEPAPTTTPPESESTTTTTLPEPEPEVEEPESTTTTLPEPEPEPALKPWEQATEPEYVWMPPEVGMLPEVWPLCDDDRETWTWRCTPPAEWQRGDGAFDPWDQPDDLPRAADRVQSWAYWCYEWPNVSCSFLLLQMNQALDYLGAHRLCVLNVYTDRVEYLSPRGSGADIDYARDSFGWHLCSTVIDPLVGELPSGSRDHDVGYRLSDTPGITLAERCRVVLTTPFPDIELETRGLGEWWLGDPRATHPTRFGQDCDAWAAYVEAHDERFPACRDSVELAEEWMEHVHGQPELYPRPYC